MKCIICNSSGSYFFSKIYSEIPFKEFMREIGPVEYCKCDFCGFVWSETHRQLDSAAWSNLNCSFHHYLEGVANERKINQPPYFEQAMMMLLLGRNGIVNLDSMLDYAAGYGSLKDILYKYCGVNLNIYDEFVQLDSGDRYVDKEDLGVYKVVINSAMFEHVLTRQDLDNVNSLVSDDGCLVIHTVVCESVPNDPDWFYLRPPVHTAFHTNKSMGILMEQWGYSSSIYCPQAKCWVLLKGRAEDYSQIVAEVNKELQSEWFFHKNGFVDYWKGY